MPASLSYEAIAALLIGPAVVTLLLFRIYRSFQSRYILYWTLSFAALSLFRLASGAIALLEPHASTLAVLFISALAGAAAVLQLALLAAGAARLWKAKELDDAPRTMLLLALGGVVFGVIPFLAGGNGAASRYSLMALQTLVATLVFAGCGIAIRRSRGKGFTMAAIAFVAYALVQLDEFVLVMRAIFGHAAASGLVPVAVADLIATTVIALGCVLIVLEEQREVALEAGSQVEHLAYYDTLTGLPNRTLFSDRLSVALAHATRHRYKLAVLFLDVDRFKQINDSLGHTVGDRLLKIVSSRIRAAIRDEDTVSRFGGDEFTVLIHIIGKIEDAGKIAQKILDALNEPITIDEREFVVTSSIGISIYPVDGTDGETLIRNADTAMYRAKELGRNSYQFYAPAMNTKALEALEIENGIRRGLLRDEFVVYYQPLVDIVAGKVFGVEALVRWNHPELGLLRPDRFIPAAEQSGLIIELGRWVLHEACKQAAEWHRRGHRVVMSVNLSGRQFQDPELIAQVREALHEARLRPEFLELEITEGYAMQDVQKAIFTLKQLKALGVRIAIDDFGTGYSCLSYLKQFPIDTLKLDGSFVRDLSCREDAQITLGVIALARSLNLQVIAEGVETIGQLAFLRDNSCHRLQGYLFSRPLPPANCDRFMVQNDQLQYAVGH